MDKKNVLITGCSTGIGKALAEEFHQQDCNVIATARNLDSLSDLKDKGMDTYSLDVTDEKAVDLGVSQIEKEVGEVSILVNNAGIIKRIPILDMPVSDFKEVIDIDLVAPLIMAKRIVPKMIERGEGKIINLCSMMSVYGRNSVSAYASAKGGLKLLTQNMTCEWAKHNIQVNGIGPGYIATAQTAPIREGNHPFNDLVMTRTPADRWGEPEDVGHAALFLASDAAGFVNGHVLYVDGGITANFGYVKGENVV